jgi:hypothetical protein
MALFPARPGVAAAVFFRRTAVVATLAVALAACQSPARYGPKEPNIGTGYTDQQLAANRYRITFTGNAATKREAVENYLLFRAAEVTAQTSYPYFLFDTRDTEAKTTYQTSLDAGPPWRGRGWYHHSWAWDGDVSTRTVTSYEAFAEIVLLTAEQAKSEPRALEAKDVLAHVGPLVRPPQP